MLFLDKKNQLILDEQMGSGTVGPRPRSIHARWRDGRWSSPRQP